MRITFSYKKCYVTIASDDNDDLNNILFRPEVIIDIDQDILKNISLADIPETWGVREITFLRGFTCFKIEYEKFCNINRIIRISKKFIDSICQ